MVNNNEPNLDRIFHALSDPTRRAILNHIARGESRVSDLPNPAKLSKAAMSKHLKILHRAELIKRQKDGREIYCHAQLESIEPAIKLLEQLGQFWRERLDSLEAYFIKDMYKGESKNEK